MFDCRAASHCPRTKHAASLPVACYRRSHRLLSGSYRPTTKTSASPAFLAIPRPPVTAAAQDPRTDPSGPSLAANTQGAVVTIPAPLSNAPSYSCQSRGRKSHEGSRYSDDMRDHQRSSIVVEKPLFGGAAGPAIPHLLVSGRKL